MSRSWAIAALLIATSVVVSADDDRKNRADELFDEGRRLIAAGEVSDACRAFQESLESLPRLGVTLNLADCEEKDGRLASASAAFQAAAELAQTSHDGRADYAAGRVRSLDARLDRVSVHAPAGVEVHVDGHPVTGSIAVDAGDHEVEATAAGKAPWRKVVRLMGEGTTVSVDVPALAASDDDVTVTGIATGSGPSDEVCRRALDDGRARALRGSDVAEPDRLAAAIAYLAHPATISGERVLATSPANGSCTVRVEEKRTPVAFGTCKLTIGIPTDSFADGDHVTLTLRIDEASGARLHLFSVDETGALYPISPTSAVPQLLVDAGKALVIPTEAMKKNGLALFAKLPPGKDVTEEGVVALALPDDEKLEIDPQADPVLSLAQVFAAAGKLDEGCVAVRTYLITRSR